MSQVTGLSRNTIDKFYTNPEIADLCLHKVSENIHIDKKKDIIIEPSAGNGSFIKGIKKIVKNYLFLDLQPEHKNIEQQDYLKFDPDEIDKYEKIHIVGNPPFGRQSSMAIKFIKKSCEYCDSFSFILPKSFKKDSLKQKIPLNFHLIYEMDIPENGFLIDNQPYNVPCVFQIWERKDHMREKSQKVESKGFEFVKKDDNPDISFRRVGVNAGFIDTDTDKSIQSHYFIKFENEIKDEILERLKNIKFETENTVGPKSISKAELIQKFNEIL